MNTVECYIHDLSLHWEKEASIYHATNNTHEIHEHENWSE